MVVEIHPDDPFLLEGPIWITFASASAETPVWLTATMLPDETVGDSVYLSSSHSWWTATNQAINGRPDGRVREGETLRLEVEGDGPARVRLDVAPG